MVARRIKGVNCIGIRLPRSRSNRYMSSYRSVVPMRLVTSRCNRHTRVICRKGSGARAGIGHQLLARSAVLSGQPTTTNAPGPAIRKVDVFEYHLIQAEQTTLLWGRIRPTAAVVDHRRPNATQSCHKMGSPFASIFFSIIGYQR
jgi:hypothetical protein